MKPNQELPWSTEREFYELHSKKMFSHFEFYHLAMIGNSATEFLSHIISKSRINAGAKVLDLGCGSGYVVNELNKIGEAIGISTSTSCIDFCKHKYPTNRYEIGNMEYFKCEELTHALALESLGYANPSKTFKITFSNLLPGGYFYIKDWCRYEHESNAQKINRVAFEHYWKYFPKTVAKYVQIASDCGFQLIEYSDITNRTNYDFFNETISLHDKEFTLPFPEISLGVAAEFLFLKPD